MENAPKIPMFPIPLKSSPVTPDISPIKKKIKKRYGDQVYIDENMFRSFLSLRTDCCKYPSDESSLAAIKRYYAHLLLLKNRIDLTLPKLVEWPWQDAFYQKQFVRTEVNYEEAAILYSLGTAYSLLGRKESRADEVSMKTACTYFQCAAWVFQALRERYGSLSEADDMTDDLFHIYNLISLNQAQECIVEKSIADSRPPTITAKLAKHLVESYSRCLDMVNNLNESIPPKFRKDWIRFLTIKKLYYASLVDFFLASYNSNEMKFGISVSHFKLAQSSIEEAWGVAKTFTDASEPQIGQAMISTIKCVRELIITNCASAVKDNSQIYHERVPPSQDLETIEGVCLAKPTPIDLTDPTVIGEDIFKDLLPIETLEASSVYSEMKANFLRDILAEVEEKDSDMDSFLSSLNLDPKELLKLDSGLPQALLDQCAKFNGMDRPPEAELSAQMSVLVDVSVDVEADLEELSSEVQATQERLKASLPLAPPSKTDPIKEQLIKVEDRLERFRAAVGEAKQSNTRLHEALLEHQKVFHLLTLSPDEIEATLPNANDLVTDDTELMEGLDEIARILSKVEEMRAQRCKMLDDLRNALQTDDVTQELLTSEKSSDHTALFQRRLEVHQEAVKLLKLNLTAQENIINALITAHAKVGVKKHEILERRRQRSEEIDALVRSGEAYDDLLLKCGEGQTFYKDVGERIRAIRSELEQINSSIQFLEPKNSSDKAPIAAPALVPSESASSGAPKLKDVLRARGSKNEAKTAPVVSAAISQSISSVNQPRWQAPQHQGQNVHPASATASKPIQPSPAPYVTPQNQFRPSVSVPSGQGYPVTYYQSPFVAGIQYPSSSPFPPTAYRLPSAFTSPQNQQQQRLPVQPSASSPSAAFQQPPSRYPLPEYQPAHTMPPSQGQWTEQQAQKSSSGVQPGSQNPLTQQQYRSPSSLSNYGLGQSYQQPTQNPSYPHQYEFPNALSGTQQLAPGMLNQPHYRPPTPVQGNAIPQSNYRAVQNSQAVTMMPKQEYFGGPNQTSLPSQQTVQAPVTGILNQPPSQGYLSTQPGQQMTQDLPYKVNPFVSNLMNQQQNSTAPPSTQAAQHPMQNSSSGVKQQYGSSFLTMQSSQQPAQSPPPAIQQTFPRTIAQQPYGYSTPVINSAQQPSTGFHQTIPTTMIQQQYRPLTQMMQGGQQTIRAGQPSVQNPPFPIQQTVPGTMIHQQYGSSAQTMVRGQQPSQNQSPYRPLCSGQTLTPTQTGQNPLTSIQQGLSNQRGASYVQTSASRLGATIQGQQYPHGAPVQLAHQPSGISTAPQQLYVGQQYPYSSSYGCRESAICSSLSDRPQAGQQVTNQENRALNNTAVNTAQFTNPLAVVSESKGENVQLESPSVRNASSECVGSFPERVTALEAKSGADVDQVVGDASTDVGKEPISPHILTEADLEVQRREKQLRATYDSSGSCLIDSITVKANGESTNSNPTAISNVANYVTNPHSDPLSDPLALNRFIDATERLLTWLETMKDSPQETTNEPSYSSLTRPSTRLEQSWSRVNEISARGMSKRPTQAAARCSVSKNRRYECMAYDFNRVQLKREATSNKDDYINASHLDFISSLGEWCPRYILTQAPLPSTVADFWSMIFDQACELIIFALPPRRRTSLLPSSIDPSESYAEGAFGDPGDSQRVPPHLPSLKIGSRLQVGTGNASLELRLQAVKLTRADSLSQHSPTVDSISQSTCIERILSLRNCSSQQTRTIVHLCYSGPSPICNDSTSIASFTAFVQTAIGFYKQQRSLMHPIAVVSEDGGGLGGIFVAASAAVLHAEVLGRVADVCELVGCLCQQRKGALDQAEQLATTCAVVALAVKQSLARRDIIVGPSSNSTRKTTSIPNEESNAVVLEKRKQSATNVLGTDEQDFTKNLFSGRPLQLSEMMSALGFASPSSSPSPFPQNKEESAEVKSTEPITSESAEKGGGSNRVFDDLPSHLVNLSLSESQHNSPSITGNTRRHYQPRDFVDKEYQESRDKLAVDSTIFEDLNPLKPQPPTTASGNE